MIKSVVFDLDGMVYFTEGYFSQYAIKKFGLDKEKINEFFRTEFKYCLMGKKDLKALLQENLASWGWKKSADEFLKEWHEYGDIDMEMVLLIKKIRKSGISCILATNNEIYRMDHFRKKHGFDNLFDKLLLSGKEGVCKPEKEMFRKITEAAGVGPDEILFCDDKEEHIAAGKEYGFITHLFKNKKSFIKEIRDLIGIY